MKIFACSDIHSAYTPWVQALKQAGFDENNPEHIIMVCGDLLDRMNETAETLKFALRLIRKGRLIYIKGNHDILMQELLNRGYAEWHDNHNGTQKSYYQLLNAHADQMDGRSPDKIVMAALLPLYDKMVNYFETKNYIFVHSWIPVTLEGKSNPICCYNENWRDATDEEWERAMWGNPFKMAEQDLNKTDKILCVGHWHCSVGWANEEGRSEFGEDAKWDIYKDEKHNVVFLDKCTAHTGRVNVLVIEDEFIK